MASRLTAILQRASNTALRGNPNTTPEQMRAFNQKLKNDPQFFREQVGEPVRKNMDLILGSGLGGARAAARAPIKLFHQTSRKNLKSILKKGLLPRSEGHTFLSTARDVKRVSKLKAMKGKTEALLEVKIPASRVIDHFKGQVAIKGRVSPRHIREVIGR